jgi:hypothetical protein
MKKTTRKTKSGTTDTRQAIEIQFESPRPGAPRNLLANVTLSFRSGLLAGLWMPGFALWRAERATTGEQFISVTVPAKKVDGTFYDWLRGNQKRLKAAIVADFERWTASRQATGATPSDHTQQSEREPWDEDFSEQEGATV